MLDPDDVPIEVCHLFWDQNRIKIDYHYLQLFKDE